MSATGTVLCMTCRHSTCSCEHRAIQTSPGLVLIAQNYASGVLPYPATNPEEWWGAIQEDMRVVLSEEMTPEIRKRWLVHVAAMIARYAEL